MAYIQRKNSAVYVYIHDPDTGKNKPLPRVKTKHLDGATDALVKSWLDNYLKTLGYESKNSQAVVGEKWLRLIDRFINTPEVQAKAYNTIYAYRKYLTEQCLVYFVNVHGLNDPTAWTLKSAGMLTYLLNERGCSPDTASRCNVALRKFWEFLIDEGEVHQSVNLRLKNPRLGNKETPLKFNVTPECILRVASTLERDDEKILLLMGYFFSLRPQETFALTRKDFFTKEQATSKECSKIMKEAGLFSGLVVNIDKQKVRIKKEGGDSLSWKIDDPKGGIKGFVACFNKEGAEAIVATIKGMSGELLPGSVDHYFKLWAGVKKRLGVTLKDLRRSSIYWLGHHTQLQAIPIKNHARHLKMETTMKYLRRPNETEESDLSLDL